MNKRTLAAALAVVLTVAGLFSLVAYVNGAQDRAFAGTETTAVYQVKNDVAAGTESGQLGSRVVEVKLPKAAVPETAVTDLGALAGQVTTSVLAPGEILTAARFSKPENLQGSNATVVVPKGMQEVTIALDSVRSVGGKLAVGDTVGIMATYGGQTNVLQNRVLITGIGSTFAPAEGQAAAAGLVRFAVTAADAAKIINASENGKVWLTKQTKDSEVSKDLMMDQKDVIGE